MAGTTKDELNRSRTNFMVTHTLTLPEGEIQFRPGSVVCFCGLVGWCKHVALIIKGNRDNFAAILNRYTEGKVSIPFVPTSDLWVTVAFEAIGDGSYKLEVDDESVKTQLHNTDNYFLGIISPGEGRAVVRDMISNWFVRFNTGDTTCKVVTHGWKSERAIQAALSSGDKGFVIANDWKLRWHNRCLPCDQAIAAGYDDLVPIETKQNTARWANGNLTRGDQPF